MNLLFLSTWFPYPPDNGSKIRAYHLIRALAEKHDVTVVAFDPTGSRAREERLGNVVVHAVAADPFRHTGKPSPVKYLSPVPLAYWPSHDMARAVGQVARSAPWDAVVCFQPPVGRYGIGIQACRVLDVDTSLTHQMRERYERQTEMLSRCRAWASWRKALSYEARLFRQFDVCTVASPEEAPSVERMVRGTPCQVAVLPNGVDCAHHPPDGYARQPGALVYNGALTYSANYDAMQYFLQDIFPLIKQRAPGASLTITGSTQGVDVSGLRLDGSVRLSGYVPDVRPVVGGATVCVVPLRQGGGTRLKILEAMALGTPVVSTSKGAEGLDVVDGVHLLIADEPARFAEATVRLLHDEALRRRLAASARRLVESAYDWREIGRRFVDLVEQCGKGGASHG